MTLMASSQEDVFLVFQNAIKYNKPDTVWHKNAKMYLKKAEEIFEELQFHDTEIAIEEKMSLLELLTDERVDGLFSYDPDEPYTTPPPTPPPEPTPEPEVQVQEEVEEVEEEEETQIVNEEMVPLPFTITHPASLTIKLAPAPPPKKKKAAEKEEVAVAETIQKSPRRISGLGMLRDIDQTVIMDDSGGRASRSQSRRPSGSQSPLKRTTEKRKRGPPKPIVVYR